MPLHLIHLRNCAIYDQLRLEEALLRADTRNWCIFNSGSTPAVVLGISGRVELFVDANRIARNPIPLIRRFSGGGTVVVDHNTLFVTFIMGKAALPHVDCYPEAIMRWSEGVYSPIFPSGIFQRMENDYAIENRKFGGNAQYLCRDRWLHHSSLLWDYDSRLMDYLLVPAKQPMYRAGRGHEEFICKLSSYFSAPDALFATVLEQLKKNFEVRIVQPHEAYAVIERPHRKATCYLPWI